MTLLTNCCNTAYLTVKDGQYRCMGCDSLLNQSGLHKAPQKGMTIFKLLYEYTGSKNLQPNTIRIYEVNIPPLLKAFLMSQYNQEDITLDEIQLSFLYRFELFLLKYENPKRGNRKLSAGTAKEYRKKLKALIEFGTNMGYFTKNPFEGYRDQKLFKQEKKADNVVRLLSHDELTKIDNEPITDDRALARTRLLFLLQTWTGFSFVDMETHDLNKVIRKGMDDKKTIIYNRVKNGELAIVPLFPETKKLLEELRYDMRPGDYLYYNNSIKSLLFRYGILRSQELGTHTGRHAFGERMLHMGFQMADISRMMGHSSIKMTESVYARVDSSKIWASYERIQSAASAGIEAAGHH